MKTAFIYTDAYFGYEYGAMHPLRIVRLKLTYELIRACGCRAFDEVVPELVYAFQPYVVVTQLGVDTFYNDPLANLHLSIFGFEKILQRIRSLAPRWVVLGGGGYEISNVARAWTLAWAVMNGIELGEDLPEAYIIMAAKEGIHEKQLRGDLVSPPLRQKRRLRQRQNGWSRPSKKRSSQRSADNPPIFQSPFVKGKNSPLLSSAFLNWHIFCFHFSIFV